MVLMVHKDNAAVVAGRVRALGFDCVPGDIAPGAHVVDMPDALAELV